LPRNSYGLPLGSRNVNSWRAGNPDENPATCLNHTRQTVPGPYRAKPSETSERHRSSPAWSDPTVHCQRVTPLQTACIFTRCLPEVHSVTRGASETPPSSAAKGVGRAVEDHQTPQGPPKADKRHAKMESRSTMRGRERARLRAETQRDTQCDDRGSAPGPKSFTITVSCCARPTARWKPRHWRLAPNRFAPSKRNSRDCF